MVFREANIICYVYALVPQFYGTKDYLMISQAENQTHA